MALVQTAFLSTTLAANIGSGSGIAITLSDYTKIDSAMANGDTMELVIDRTSATVREVVLVTKVSNGNYTLTTRGLYQTTAQTHASAEEVTNDDTPGYFNGLRDGTAFSAGSSTVGMPMSSIRQQASTAHTATLVGFSGTPTQANYYFRIGNEIHVYYDIQGTSNATNFTASLPAAAKYTQQFSNGRYVDNGSFGAGPPLISVTASSSTVTFSTSLAGGTWTGSAGKQIQCLVIYEAA